MRDPPRVGAPDVRCEGAALPFVVLRKIEIIIVARRGIDQRRPVGMAAEQLRRQRLRVATGMVTIGAQEIFERRDLLAPFRSEEPTSELQSLMRLSYAVFCLNKKTKRSI